MSAPYYVGDRVAVQTPVATPFTHLGTPTDPTTVTYEVKRPDTGVVTTYTYGTSSNVTKLSTGRFKCEFTVDASGVWDVHEVGTGAVQAASRTFLTVLV